MLSIGGVVSEWFVPEEIDRSEVPGAIVAEGYKARAMLIPLGLTWVVLLSAPAFPRWRMTQETFGEAIVQFAFLGIWGVMCLALMAISLLILIFSVPA